MPAGLVSIHPAQTSVSEDAILTTNYLDDYIVRGNVYNYSAALSATADTSLFFTSELPANSISAAFLLPVSINPTTGFATLYIYEDTGYTGGTLQTIRGRNRSLDTPDNARSQVRAGATGSEKGTLIFTGVYGAAASGGFFGGSAGGGEGDSANSIILNVNKRYLYELVNSETATIGVNAEFAEI